MSPKDLSALLAEDYRSPEWPLAALSVALEQGVTDLQQDERGLSFETPLGGRTEVQAALRRDHGMTIRVLSHLPESLDALSLEAIGLVNAEACFSALVREKDGLWLMTRLAMPGDASELWPEALPLLAFSALFQVRGFMHTLDWLGGRDFSAWRAALPGVTDPCYWQARDFEPLCTWAGAVGLLPPGGTQPTDRLDLRLPWSALAAMGLPEAEVQIVIAGREHPVFGQGLGYELVTPSIPGDQGHALADALNRLEGHALEGAGFLGAWSALPATRQLKFRGFWPNLMHRPAQLPELGLWLVERARWLERRLSAPA